MGCLNCRPPAESEYPTVVGWRAWFDDGSVYDSTEHAWAWLPDDGVLGVVLFESTRAPGGQRTRQMVSGYDTYFESTDRLTGARFVGGNNDPVETVEARYLDAVAKRGRWASTETVQRVNVEMAEARWLDDGD